MDLSGSAAGRTGSAARVIPAPVLLALFASALFLSALLLFAVQPMFAKMVLPVLGGSPAVWSVAMCFFQAALLAGYAYAHWLNDRLRTPIGVILHLGVLMLAMFLLPLGIAAGWDHPPEQGLHLWVLALFAVSIGLPFFALAGNAPLLQAWFARTGHRHASDPYFLYGASNLGSLLALLSYPLLVEPGATLAQQSMLWSLGYKLLAVLIGVCGLVMLVARVPRAKAEGGQGRGGDAATVTMSQRFVWAGLAFVPSGLLVAVTSHITTDVAAAPFLWVLPLALFLLTFVIAFQRRPVLPHKLMLAVQPAAVAALVVSMQFPLEGYWAIFLLLHLLCFFVSAMVCHGELVRRRPAAAALTQFYLWMSLGGALGGLFTALIAPYLFSTVIEYPIMIVLALLARPGFHALDPKSLAREAALAAVLLAAVAGPKFGGGVEIIDAAPKFYIVAFAALAVAILLARPKPLRLVALVTVTLVAGHILKPETVKGESHRGFFGVNKVIVTPDGKYRLLTHGTTLHGAQDLAAREDRPEPLTYYHRAGPFADVFAAARAQHPLGNVAVVGLGTGSLACYAAAGENWRFFEIDPIVIRLASDARRFRFLSACAPGAKLIVGDARLTLGEQPASRYDLIVLDAFSSDAIPVHLLTREALAMYLAKLAPGGIIAFHISNRNVDLRPVFAAAAKELGLAALTRHGGHAGKLRETYKSPATLVAFARGEEDLEALRKMDGWRPLRDKGWRVWSDDYSNVLGAILASLGGDGTSAKPDSDN